MCVLADQLVRLINHQQIASVGVEEVADAVDPAPDRSIAGGQADAVLDCLHKVAAAHGVVAFDVCDVRQLGILAQGVGLTEAAAGDHDTEADVFLAALADAEHRLCVPAFVEARLLGGLGHGLYCSRKVDHLAGALGQEPRDRLLDAARVAAVGSA